MLDLNVADICNEKPTRTTQVRHGDSLAALIKHAAAVLGVTKSVFLRAAIEREANRILEANSRHVLTKEDAKLFAEVLDTPAAPTPHALKAAESYRRRVLHAD